MRERLGLLVRLLKRLSAPLYWWYEKRLEHEVRTVGKLPTHLGLILDGNRRYARAKGMATELGHTMGADKAKQVIEWCADLGITHITLWVFSSDNKSRDESEVAHLYRLFAEQARAMAQDGRVHRHRVRVRTIGELDQLPEDVRASFAELEQATQDYDGLQLYIALAYGGREEIVAAMRKALLARAQAGQSLAQAAAELSAEDINAALYAAPRPEPDFIIRTSGEIRLSGFLLWQSVYSEFYFCDAYWPEFRKTDFLRALRSYQQRQRRYGR
ncbi:MAG: polyprenyl diphosphate synthase [Sinobacteraceae bacterium]|nr:polyprenyl diphosphate synthase [Nevskiaceae bacterium]